VYISKHGSGPRKFLGLHGWSGDHRTFDPLIRVLPSDVTFYAIDLPGCGRSEDPPSWSLKAIADEVAESVGIIPGQFTLVGNCSGALLGMLAAQRLRGRIERMLLIDVFAVFPWYFRIFLTPGLGLVAYYSTFANPVGRWLTNLSLAALRSSTTTLTGGFAETRHASNYRYLNLFENYPAPETFGDLEMRIDLVYGEKTFDAVGRSIPRWKSVWPHAGHWKLAGAGHLPILEATAQLRQILFQERSVST
jgi:pimeloyl-ACP methyl ester carboxylesterase